MGFDNDGHTNHDDRLSEINLTMLNELNCAFGVSLSRFHCCGVMVMVVAVKVCGGRHLLITRSNII